MSLSQNIHTSMDNERRTKIMNEFYSCKSLGDKLKAFTDAEECFAESELGMACFTLSAYFYVGGDHGKALSFGQRALTILSKGDHEKARYFAQRTLRTVANEDKLKASSDADECFEESEGGGVSCLALSIYFYMGGDYEKALSFAQRASRILADNSNSAGLSVFIATAIKISGRACFRLKRYTESLDYLNKACGLLNDLDGDDSLHGSKVVLYNLHDAETGLFEVYKILERRDEAIVHLRNALEIKEKIMKDDVDSIYSGYRDLVNEYIDIKNYKEALPFCLKALNILTRDLGHYSQEVYDCRRSLGKIYGELNEIEKAFEQNQIALSEIKKFGACTHMLETEASDMQINLGRYSEAVKTMTAAIPQTGEESEERAVMLASMGRALWNLDKFEDAKRCLEISFGILDKLESYSHQDIAAATFLDIAELCERMKEFEIALSILMRARKLIDKLPHKHLQIAGKYYSRLGSITLYYGDVMKAIQYLREGVEKLKQSGGLQCHEVGRSYNDLGVIYTNVGNPMEAVVMLEHAKDIVDVSHGPDDMFSLSIRYNLSRAYADLGRYSEAVNLLEKAIEGLKKLGPSAQDKVDSATEFLNELKKRAMIFKRRAHN